MKKKLVKGYTLIEMLIVIVIFMTVGLFVISTMFLTLRTAAKTTIVNKIRQNGNFAIEQMSQSLRDAKSFTGMYDPSTGSYASCVGGVTQTDSANDVSIQFVDFNNNTITYGCGKNTPPHGGIFVTNSNGSVSNANLLDKNTVEVKSCQITCTQATVTDPPTFSINFVLSNVNGSGALQENQVGDQTFETSVNMRNNVQKSQSQ